MDLATILLTLWTLLHTTITFAMGNMIAPGNVNFFEYTLQIALFIVLNFVFFFQADQHLIHHHVLGPMLWALGYIEPLFSTATIDCDLWANEIDKIKRLPLPQYLEERQCNGIFDGLSAQSQGNWSNQLFVSIALVVLGATMAIFLFRVALSQLTHTINTLSKAYRTRFAIRQDQTRSDAYRTAIDIHLVTICTQATRITKLQEECKGLKDLIKAIEQSCAEQEINQQQLKHTTEEANGILKDAEDTAVQKPIISYKEQVDKEITQMHERFTEVQKDLQQQHAIEKQYLRSRLEGDVREEQDNSRKKLMKLGKEHAKERDALRKDLASKEQRISDLYQQVDAKNKEFEKNIHARVETEIQTRVESQAEEFSQQSVEKENELLATKSTLAKAKGEVKSTQNQLAEKEDELTRVMKELQQANAELTEARNNATRDQNHLANKLAELDLVKTQLTQANAHVAENKEQVSAKETALANAEVQAASIRSQLAGKEGELACVAKQLADANALIDEKKGQLSATENDLTTVRDQAASTENLLMEKDEELARVKNELDILVARNKYELSAKDAALEKAGEDASSTQNQLAEKEGALFRLKVEAERLINNITDELAQKEIELADAKNQVASKQTEKQDELAGLKNLFAEIDQVCHEAFFKINGQTGNLQISIPQFIHNVSKAYLYEKGGHEHYSRQYEKEKAQHIHFKNLYNSASNNADNDNELKCKFNLLLKLHYYESQMLNQQSSLLESSFKELSTVFQQCFVIPQIKNLMQSEMKLRIKELQNQWSLLSQHRTLQPQPDVEMTQPSPSTENQQPPTAEAQSQEAIEMVQQPPVVIEDPQPPAPDAHPQGDLQMSPSSSKPAEAVFPAPAERSPLIVPKPQQKVDMTEYNNLVARVISQEQTIQAKGLVYSESWERMRPPSNISDEEKIKGFLPILKKHHQKMRAMLKK